MTAGNDPNPRQGVNIAAEAARALGILRSLGDAAPQQVIRQAVGVLKMAQLWTEAADALSLVKPVTAGAAAERRYCVNLAAARDSRPELYASLLSTTGLSPYEVFDAGSGTLLVGRSHPDGKRSCLSKSFDPNKEVAQIRGSLDPHMARGESVFILGLGDGYLIESLWRRPLAFLYNRQVPLILVASDMALLHALLHIHDWSADNGPIRAARFVWCAGPNWRVALESLPDAQRYLPIPKIVVRQEDAEDALAEAVSRLCSAYSKTDESLRLANAEHYRVKTREELLDALSPQPSRQPRMLIVTSRFTSVLQFAARDTASAFQDMGWRVVTAIEPADHLTIPQVQLRRMVLEDKPDVIFLLDHVRYEVEGIFPPELPVVTWVQDLLPHLIQPTTASKIGPRDFVLTCFAPLLAETYRYPARQLIDTSAMLTMRPAAVSTSAERHDIVYFSNVSGAPDPMIAATIQRSVEGDRPATSAAAHALLGLYERGGAVPTIAQLRGHVRSTRGFTSDEHAVTRIADKLWNPLNTGLYRQQALAWVRDAATRLGLSLAIYGNGWRDNPRFATHARGYLAHGDATRSIMRTAKFNLHLEPYPCVSHHRLLDALAAGGFCLVREHPSHHLLPRLAKFLHTLGCGDAATADEARQRIPVESRAALDASLKESAILNYHDSPDPIPQLRCWQRAGVLAADGMLPELDAVSFRDEAGVESLLKRYMDDAPARAELAERQWRSVEPRLTFVATMRRLVREMHEKIAGETA